MITAIDLTPGQWTAIGPMSILQNKSSTSGVRLSTGRYDTATSKIVAPALDTSDYIVLPEYDRSVAHPFTDLAGFMVWAMPDENEVVQIAVL